VPIDPPDEEESRFHIDISVPPELSEDDLDTRIWLVQIFKELDDNDREFAIDVFVRRLDTEELSIKYGISKDAVRKRIERLRTCLREKAREHFRKYVPYKLKP
jgi:DNA-directed RNA polymerase specialized sigma24 family protein